MIMCNIDDYIKDLVLYIKTTLDYRTEVTAFDKKQLADIPTAIGASFKFYNANLLDTPVTFAFCKNSSDVTPAQLQKQMQVVERRLNTTVIVLLDNVASYNLQRLVAQRVNFIIPHSLFSDCGSTLSTSSADSCENKDSILLIIFTIILIIPYSSFSKSTYRLLCIQQRSMPCQMRILSAVVS